MTQSRVLGIPTLVYLPFCFFKWDHIPAGRQLTEEEQQYAVAVLMAWIEKQV